VVSEEISGHEKCIKQLAQSAVKNAKFHSSQRKAGLFIAENAIRIKEDFNSLEIANTAFCFLFLIFYLYIYLARTYAGPYNNEIFLNYG